MDQFEKKLLKIFRTLDAQQRAGLLDYAKFLLERHAPLPDAPTEPLTIPRPEHESVVAAMKRLRATYPMVDTGTVLDEASSLMAQHLVQGRPNDEVIDELEALFAARFAALQEADA